MQVIHSLKILTTGLLIGSFVNSAYAEELDARKWYVTGSLGASLLSDPDADFTPKNGTERKGKLKVDSGMLFGGSVGYFLMPDLRVEGEIVYRSNEISSTTVNGLDRRQGDSDIASVMYMANIIKDFNGFSTSFANFKPYVGIGVGLAQEIDVDAEIGGKEREFSDSNRFAYQALGGVNWYYRSGWFAGAGLRYMDAGKPKLDGSAGDLDVDYDGLSAELKIGFRF